MKRPTANHFGGWSQMLVDGRQPLDDTWCFFLPSRRDFCYFRVGFRGYLEEGEKQCP